jgi:hypothetical protein
VAAGPSLTPAHQRNDKDVLAEGRSPLSAALDRRSAEQCRDQAWVHRTMSNHSPLIAGIVARSESHSIRSAP